MRQIDYYTHAKDNVPKLCSPEKLRELMASAAIAEQVQRVRTAPDEAAKLAAKSKLPAICWHGHCTAETRCKNAVKPSALAMLDLDGMGAPLQLPPEGGEPSAACRPQWIDDLLARIREIFPAITPRPAFAGANDNVNDNDNFSDSLKPVTSEATETAEGIETARSAMKPSTAGLCLIHVTPSGQGLRIVGDMSVIGCRRIEEWQKKMVELLDLHMGERQGLYHIDTCVKDLSRLSFVVPASEVLFIDEELLWSDPAEGWTYEQNNNDRAGAPATSDSESLQAKAPDIQDAELEQARSFTYNGRTLTEIAEHWLNVYGHPIVGERHAKYYQMCTLFKNLCERDANILYAQLPRFGKPDAECRASCNDAIRRQPSHSLDPDFYDFLVTYGYKERPRTMSDIRAAQSAKVLTDKVAREEAERKARDDERLSQLMADIEATNTAADDWGKYPSVYNIYKRVFPTYMHKPAVLALDAIMGTYFTNVTARYLNGKMERPCFHNLIVGPASCGKGFVADMHADLTAKLLNIDTESLVMWQQYDRERARKRGAKELPEEPDVHYRLMETVFSNSSLLKRQAQGNGQHQLVFCTEMDSLYKNGGHKKFDDIYRCAYHMEEMSQFYLWSDGFNGRVKLLLNVLATGTPQQFATHYPTPENGLISRVNWYRIKEMFSNEFIAKEMTSMERAYLDRVTDFALSLSYGEDEEGSRTYKPIRDITDEMAFMLPVCQDFLNKHLAIARETMDQSRDQFRKRIALDMFRGAMVDWGCALGKLDKKRRQTIIDFRWAKAEEMLETKVAEFSDMVNHTTEVKAKRYPSLYDGMSDEFTILELEQQARALEFTTPIRNIIYTWTKAELIKKTSNNKFIKTKKK